MFNKAKVEPKLANLTESPGVYIMKNVYGEVIYVGKAINLRRRVTQYFRNSVKLAKVQAMVDNVDDFEYVLTLSEADALTLEATLVKKHMPRYNILLKDDKWGGAYIKIDLKAEYPTLEITRKHVRDGAKYFGPYANGSAAKLLVGAIKSAYGVRTCSKSLKSKRECLDYHIGLCLAPCGGRVSAEDYAVAVKKTVDFLSGKSDDILEDVRHKMLSAAENEDFERALEHRNLLEKLQNINERSIIKLDITKNVDIFAYITDDIRSGVTVMPVRGSKLLAAQNFPSEDASESGEALGAFIVQYYMKNPIPDEVFINMDLGDSLETVLRDMKKGTVRVHRPQKGMKRDLVLTAEANAREFVAKLTEKQTRVNEQTYGAADKLCEILGLKSAHRIECYDISHISGTDKVASGVCFINGSKAASEYRRYKIKTVEGNDDFRCMAEVLTRRLSRASAGDEKFTQMPDLIVIDGGKGQLHAAHDVMTAAGFDIPMVGLAERDEEIFTIGNSQPIRLSKESAPLKLLQRIRDEAHRFAVTYHRNTRIKRIKTKLTEIAGVGEKKAGLLLKKFGSVKNISILPIEALESVVDKSTARNIYQHYNPEKKAEQ